MVALVYDLFIILTAGLIAGVVSKRLFTPLPLRLGLRWTRRMSLSGYERETQRGPLPPMPQEAIVIGLGPIGRQAASQLEIMGTDVCPIDLSPVNLYAHPQQGFRTVSGDARELDGLDRAGATRSRLAVISVPDDPVACQIVKKLSNLNPTCTIVVCCRYQPNKFTLRRAGACAVVSEQEEASVALLRLLERMNSR